MVKKIDPKDYEAAFLFNHFISTCHQKSRIRTRINYGNPNMFYDRNSFYLHRERSNSKPGTEIIPRDIHYYRPNEYYKQKYYYGENYNERHPYSENHFYNENHPYNQRYPYNENHFYNENHPYNEKYPYNEHRFILNNKKIPYYENNCNFKIRQFDSKNDQIFLRNTPISIDEKNNKKVRFSSPVNKTDGRNNLNFSPSQSNKNLDEKFSNPHPYKKNSKTQGMSNNREEKRNTQSENDGGFICPYCRERFHVRIKLVEHLHQNHAIIE